MIKLLDYLYYILYKNTLAYQGQAAYGFGLCLMFYIWIIYWIIALIFGIGFGLIHLCILAGCGFLVAITIVIIYSFNERYSDVIAYYHSNHPSRLKMIFHLILFFSLPFLLGALLIPVTRWVGENGGSLIKIVFG